MIVSMYMPYDSREPVSAQEVKELVHKANEDKLDLLLGYEANSHPINWVGRRDFMDS